MKSIKGHQIPKSKMSSFKAQLKSTIMSWANQDLKKLESSIAHLKRMMHSLDKKGRENMKPFLENFIASMEDLHSRVQDLIPQSEQEEEVEEQKTMEF